MTTIGVLKTEKSIENAMSELRHWLTFLGVNGFDIDMRHDAKRNIALIRFPYKGKNYEFRSDKQKNCRLNMHGIARVMEYKVRAFLMGIEDFEKSMVAYLQIEGTVGEGSGVRDVNYRSYAVLNLDPLASNDEIQKKYKSLVKGFHPDMALSEEAKNVFTKKLSEINEAYAEIKKERGL